MSDQQQKNELVLAFTEEGRSEAPKTSQEGTESRTAKCETERPAGDRSPYADFHPQKKAKSPKTKEQR
jgi:hypothetical protein